MANPAICPAGAGRRPHRGQRTLSANHARLTRRSLPGVNPVQTIRRAADNHHGTRTAPRNRRLLRCSCRGCSMALRRGTIASSKRKTLSDSDSRLLRAWNVPPRWPNTTSLSMAHDSTWCHLPPTAALRSARTTGPSLREDIQIGHVLPTQRFPLDIVFCHFPICTVRFGKETSAMGKREGTPRVLLSINHSREVQEARGAC